MLDNELIVDLAVLRDVAAVSYGSTIQQVPLGHCGGGLTLVAALFHLEGVHELSAWRYAPQLRMAAAFGPDEATAEALRDWLHSPSATFSPVTEGSRVSIFAPGSTLTVVVSLTPPTLRQLADQVSDWLMTHYGPGTLFDCGLAIGDVCLFVYMPEQVSNLFAGAVQIVRAHPFFRLVSRGALHRTPAERLRFLTFETDAANTVAIPQGASSSGSSHGSEVERAALPREEGSSYRLVLSLCQGCLTVSGTRIGEIRLRRPSLLGITSVPSLLRPEGALSKGLVLCLPGIARRMSHALQLHMLLHAGM